MAEFQDVMKQWRRFCKSHSNCGECEFDGKGICGEAHLSDVPYSNMELRIMSWAAEHPETVYPTWLNWLGVEGLVIITKSGYAFDFTKAAEQIPRIYCEKLGIPPKKAKS